MPPNVRFFAGFTSSSAFRYSVIFIVRLKKFQTTPPLFGLSSFLYLSFRDCGCGKAMSFDDYFRKDRHDPLVFLFLASGAIQTTTSGRKPTATLKPCLFWKQRPDTELEASGFRIRPSRLRPKEGVTDPPGPSPRDSEVKCARSPERAAQWHGFVSPLQGSRINVHTDPRAMPWADSFGPFRTKSEDRKSWLHFRSLGPSAVFGSTSCVPVSRPHAS